MDEALLSNSSVGRDQLGEMIITLEPHGIVRPVKRDWAVLSKDTPVDISI